MTALKTITFAPCLVVLTASLAQAQQSRPTTTAGLEHGYMTATAGAAFSDRKSATFGVEIGERIGRRVQAYVAFTYFDDLLNDRAAADLVSLAAHLENITGQSYDFSGRDRGLAFSGGAKYLISTGPRVRPYVGAAPGVLNIQRVITDRYLGDVSDPVIGLYGAPDGVINPYEVSSFKPMAEFIAGVGIAVGRTYVDVGYRYRAVFQTSESFNFSQFTGGIGMRF